jgi:hypothetical protein
MTAGHRNLLAMVAACALLVTATDTAKAQIGVTKSQADWIVVGIAAIGAGIGLGIYFAVRPHGHSLTGCAGSGPDGPELVSENDQQIYALTGELAGIKSGERIRVSGKKEMKKASAPQQFLVEKLNKDLGACKAQPAIR